MIVMPDVRRLVRMIGVVRRGQLVNETVEVGEVRSASREHGGHALADALAPFDASGEKHEQGQAQQEAGYEPRTFEHPGVGGRVLVRAGRRLVHGLHSDSTVVAPPALSGLDGHDERPSDPAWSLFSTRRGSIACGHCKSAASNTRDLYLQGSHDDGFDAC